MNNEFNNYILVNNQLLCVYKESERHFTVFDRTSTDGTSVVRKSDVNACIDVSSKSFIQLANDFKNYISIKLHSADSKDIDEVPHSVALFEVITQCFEDSTFIMDYEQFSEIYIDDCCEQTIKFLGKTITPLKYIPVKLYIIEQILQKHYCHKFNDEWLINKKSNYQFDLYTGPKVAILC